MTIYYKSVIKSLYFLLVLAAYSFFSFVCLFVVAVSSKYTGFVTCMLLFVVVFWRATDLLLLLTVSVTILMTVMPND